MPWTIFGFFKRKQQQHKYFFGSRSFMSINRWSSTEKSYIEEEIREKYK